MPGHATEAAAALRRVQPIMNSVVFTGFHKGDLRPEFHHTFEAVFVSGKICRVPIHVKCQIRPKLFSKLPAFRIVAVYPTGGDIKSYAFVRGIDTVLVLKPGKHHVELEDAHRPQDKIASHDGAEELHRSFLGELDQAFLQLLGFQGCLQPHPAEMLRGEIGNAGEFERFFLRKRVADLDRAMIVDADDIARVGLLHIGCGPGP